MIDLCGKSLKDTINGIIESGTIAFEDIRHVLERKGVSVPEKFTISDLSKLIDRIDTTDFEFFCNFKEIDQFGYPKSRNLGQASGGSGIDISMHDLLIPSLIQFGLEDEHDIILISKPIGAFGVGYYGENEQLIEEFPDVLAISFDTPFRKESQIDVETLTI